MLAGRGVTESLVMVIGEPLLTKMGNADTLKARFYGKKGSSDVVFGPNTKKHFADFVDFCM